MDRYTKKSKSLENKVKDNIFDPQGWGVIFFDLKMSKTYKNIFVKVDETDKITDEFFENNAGLPFDLQDNFHVCLWGKSWCGKSNAISQMLEKYYIHKIKPQHMYIFSPSFEYDKSYTPIWNYLKLKLGDEYGSHVLKAPAQGVLNNILAEQQKLQQINTDWKFEKSYNHLERSTANNFKASLKR